MTNAPKIITSRRRLLLGAGAGAVALAAPSVWSPSRAAGKRIVVRDDGGIYTKAYGAVYYRPFTEATGIEVVGVQANAEPVAQIKTMFAWLNKQGIDGVVPLGGTGEYGALARAERIKMAGLSVKAMAGKGPVIAGVLDTGFHDALQAGREFAAEGVDGLLVLTPYYTNPTQAGIRDYFLRYADASPVPVLIYEIPYRTRIAIEPKILHVVLSP